MYHQHYLRYHWDHKNRRLRLGRSSLKIPKTLVYVRVLFQQNKKEEKQMDVSGKIQKSKPNFELYLTEFWWYNGSFHFDTDVFIIHMTKVSLETISEQSQRSKRTSTRYTFAELENHHFIAGTERKRAKNEVIVQVSGAIRKYLYKIECSRTCKF